MGFTEAISSCLRKFATFSGRASRSEYWYWQLFMFLLVLVIIILCFVAMKEAALFAITPVIWIINIVSLLPNLAVLVRRLHDIGRSGWSVLFALIPVIGSIILLVFCLTESQDGDNEYGPNPNANAGIQQFATNRPQQNRVQSSASSYGTSKPSYGESKSSYGAAKPSYTDSEETVISSGFSGTNARLVFNGKTIPLASGRNIVGRKAKTSQANVQIPADDLYMSRLHCVINVSYGADGRPKVMLSNYQNKNRTAVNGRVINGQDHIRLSDGNQITLGRTTMTFKTT